MGERHLGPEALVWLRTTSRRLCVALRQGPARRAPGGRNRREKKENASSETAPPNNRPRRNGPKLRFAYGENRLFFLFVFRLSYGQKGAAIFSPSALKKGVALKNGGAASRTLAPAHGALSGILAKKVRQRTAARLKYDPGWMVSSAVLLFIGAGCLLCLFFMFVVSSRFPLFLCFFLNFFRLIHVFFLRFSFLVRIVWYRYAGLQTFVFCPRAHCGWH